MIKPCSFQVTPETELQEELIGRDKGTKYRRKEKEGTYVRLIAKHRRWVGGKQSIPIYKGREPRTIISIRAESIFLGEVFYYIVK